MIGPDLDTLQQETVAWLVMCRCQRNKAAKGRWGKLDLTKQKKWITHSSFWLLTGLTVWLCLRFLAGYLLPFLLGYLIAWMLRPVASFLTRHSGIQHRSASIVAALLFYLALGGLLWCLWLLAYRQLHRMKQELPLLLSEQVMPFLSQLGQKLNAWERRFIPDGELALRLEQSAGELLSAASARCLEWMGGLAQQVPGFLLALLFAIIASVIICADYDAVTGFALRQIPDRIRQVLPEIRDYLVGTVRKIIRAYLILMVITFACLAGGLGLLGVSRFWLIAAVTALLDLLPVIGSGLVLVPWGILSLSTGDSVTGIGLLVLWAGISILHQILEPKLVGDQIGLHPLATLVAMYIGLRAGGVAGLVLMPVLFLLIQYLHTRRLLHVLKFA